MRVANVDHGFISYHDVDGLDDPSPNTLLHIGNTILLTDCFDQRLRPLVLKHRHVGPHVVLNLVVEPAVHGVDDVATAIEVDGTHDLSAVEVVTSQRMAAVVFLAVSMQVISSVIGNNGRKAMQISHHFSDQHVNEDVPGSIVSEKDEENTWNGNEVDGNVGEEALGPKQPAAGTERLHKSEIKCPAKFLAGAFFFLFHLLGQASVEGLRSIICKLPNACQSKHVDVLENFGKLTAAQNFSVDLNDVGITNRMRFGTSVMSLAEFVVVQRVVLFHPRLGLNPVRKIDPSVQTFGIILAGPLSRNVGNFVVTTVKNVMSAHGPRHEAKQADGEG